MTPGWGYLQTSEPRAQGWGYRSYGMLGRRFLPELEDGQEGALLDVEIHDDGRVSLFSGHVSGHDHRRELVIDQSVVILTRAIVTLSGMLGVRAGYAGAWALAVGVTDMAGKRTSGAVNAVRGLRYPRFSADAYVQGTQAVTIELVERPGAVTARLVRRLLRALGRDDSHSLLQDQPVGTRAAREQAWT